MERGEERGEALALDESSVLFHYLMIEHVAWLDAETFLVQSSAVSDTSEFPVAPREVNSESVYYAEHRAPSNYFLVSSDGGETVPLAEAVAAEDDGAGSGPGMSLYRLMREKEKQVPENRAHFKRHYSSTKNGRRWRGFGSNCPASAGAT